MPESAHERYRRELQGWYENDELSRWLVEMMCLERRIHSFGSEWMRYANWASANDRQYLSLSQWLRGQVIGIVRSDGHLEYPIIEVTGRDACDTIFTISVGRHRVRLEQTPHGALRVQRCIETKQQGSFVTI